VQALGALELHGFYLDGRHHPTTNAHHSLLINLI
jgi:hypothetical protein